jgi:hypothetical protein
MPPGDSNAASPAVAADADDYVALAVRLAAEPAWRDEITARILRHKPLAYHNDAPIRALEEFIQRAVTHPRSPE